MFGHVSFCLTFARAPEAKKSREVNAVLNVH